MPRLTKSNFKNTKNKYIRNRVVALNNIVNVAASKMVDRISKKASMKDINNTIINVIVNEVGKETQSLSADHNYSNAAEIVTLKESVSDNIARDIEIINSDIRGIGSIKLVERDQKASLPEDAKEIINSAANIPNKEMQHAVGGIAEVSNEIPYVSNETEIITTEKEPISVGGRGVQHTVQSLQISSNAIKMSRMQSSSAQFSGKVSEQNIISNSVLNTSVSNLVERAENVVVRNDFTPQAEGKVKRGRGRPRKHPVVSNSQKVSSPGVLTSSTSLSTTPVAQSTFASITPVTQSDSTAATPKTPNTSVIAVSPNSSATPVISNDSATPVISNASATPVISNDSATPVVSNDSATPVISNDSATPVVSNASATPVTPSSSGTRKSERMKKKKLLDADDIFVSPEPESLKKKLDTSQSTPHVIRTGKRGRPRKYPPKEETPTDAQLDESAEVTEAMSDETVRKGRKSRPRKCVKYADLNSGLESSESVDAMNSSDLKNKAGNKKEDEKKRKLEEDVARQNEALESGVCNENCLQEQEKLLPLKKRKKQMLEEEGDVTESAENNEDSNAIEGQIEKMAPPVTHKKRGRKRKSEYSELPDKDAERKNEELEMTSSESEYKETSGSDEEFIPEISKKEARDMQKEESAPPVTRKRSRKRKEECCELPDKDAENINKELKIASAESEKISRSDEEITLKKRSSKKLETQPKPVKIKPRKLLETRKRSRKRREECCELPDEDAENINKELKITSSESEEMSRSDEEFTRKKRSYKKSKTQPTPVKIKPRKLLEPVYVDESILPDWKPEVSMWTLLSESEYLDYLPPLKNCVPFKIRKTWKQEETDWMTLDCFESIPLSKEPNHFTFFTGGPVWSSAWCPVQEKEKSLQYIALATVGDFSKYHSYLTAEIEKGLLQLWCLGYLNECVVDQKPSMALGISHEYGVIFDMAWCPRGCWEDPSVSEVMNESKLPRLGLLALACSDAFVRIFSIPHPNLLPTSDHLPVYAATPSVVLKPLYGGTCAATVQSMCLSLSWSKFDSCERIAASYGNGMVCIWNLNSIGTILVENTLPKAVSPYQVFNAHSTPVTSIAFCPLPDSQFLVSAGIDKTLKFWDLLDTSLPFFSCKKGIGRTVHWAAGHCGAVVSLDVAVNSMNRSSFFKECGTESLGFKTLSDLEHCIMKSAVSDILHSQALGDATGTVIVSFISSQIMEYVKPSRFDCYNVYNTEVKDVSDLSEVSVPGDSLCFNLIFDFTVPVEDVNIIACVEEMKEKTVADEDYRIVSSLLSSLVSSVESSLKEEALVETSKATTEDLVDIVSISSEFLETVESTENAVCELADIASVTSDLTENIAKVEEAAGDMVDVVSLSEDLIGNVKDTEELASSLIDVVCVSSDLTGCVVKTEEVVDDVVDVVSLAIELAGNVGKSEEVTSCLVDVVSLATDLTGNVERVSEVATSLMDVVTVASNLTETVENTQSMKVNLVNINETKDPTEMLESMECNPKLFELLDQKETGSSGISLALAIYQALEKNPRLLPFSITHERLRNSVLKESKVLSTCDMKTKESELISAGVSSYNTILDDLSISDSISSDVVDTLKRLLQNAEKVNTEFDANTYSVSNLILWLILEVANAVGGTSKQIPSSLSTDHCNTALEIQKYKTTNQTILGWYRNIYQDVRDSVSCITESVSLLAEEENKKLTVSKFLTHLVNITSDRENIPAASNYLLDSVEEDSVQIRDLLPLLVKSVEDSQPNAHLENICAVLGKKLIEGMLNHTRDVVAVVSELVSSVEKKDSSTNDADSLEVVDKNAACGLQPDVSSSPCTSEEISKDVNKVLNHIMDTAETCLSICQSFESNTSILKDQDKQLCDNVDKDSDSGIEHMEVEELPKSHQNISNAEVKSQEFSVPNAESTPSVNLQLNAVDSVSLNDSLMECVEQTEISSDEESSISENEMDLDGENEGYGQDFSEDSMLSECSINSSSSTTSFSTASLASDASCEAMTNAVNAPDDGCILPASDLSFNNMTAFSSSISTKSDIDHVSLETLETILEKCTNSVENSAALNIDVPKNSQQITACVEESVQDCVVLDNLQDTNNDMYEPEVIIDTLDENITENCLDIDVAESDDESEEIVLDESIVSSPCNNADDSVICDNIDDECIVADKSKESVLPEEFNPAVLPVEINPESARSVEDLDVSAESSEKQAKSAETVPDEFPCPFPKYEDLISKYGLIFNDANTVNKEERTPMKESTSGDSDTDLNSIHFGFRLSSVNTVSWNPNYGCHNWLFTAGQSGIARLSYVSDR